MSDETGTTSEVARVLGEHPTWFLTAHDRVTCTGCTVELGTAHVSDVSVDEALFAQHQADMLAEAGLLRDRSALAAAFESGARSYAASDPCCGTYHLHEIENPNTGEPIPTREGEDDL